MGDTGIDLKDVEFEGVKLTGEEKVPGGSPTTARYASPERNHQGQRLASDKIGQHAIDAKPFTYINVGIFRGMRIPFSLRTADQVRFQLVRGWDR
jgi:hypothetical protein